MHPPPRYPVLTALLALLSLAATSAYAAERPAQAPAAAREAAVRTLSPAQITAIRAVGRNVLAAKKSAAEDGADAAQLSRLRASLDAVIAADLDPRNRTPITVQGEESGAQRKARQRVASLRESARADARAVAAQLRSRGELKAAHARSAPEQDTRSAGLPIGEQRARLFERWTQKLDAALADDGAQRVVQLRELQEQLRPTKGRVSEAPLTHGTPTLQAMPAGFMPPGNSGDNGAAKE
ncbi:hypothetical protein [Denitromonas iodatirespirans]|uniref:DUF3106 domain-containing protein n=1 Tax=Denitromonas iodatirespirans TaxID=2795389 RepID=A0A944D5B0_DENI1|nr:hypothetical protein [Denitromonas iodatirespirans]MBT0960255.1 hypothetical protein [Denitromonas iodatirespirans]